MSSMTDELELIQSLNKKVESTTVIKEKIIYAKRKTFSREDVNATLALEVEYFMRQDPSLSFVKVEFLTKNDDRSHTYQLFFTKQV